MPPFAMTGTTLNATALFALACCSPSCMRGPPSEAAACAMATLSVLPSPTRFLVPLFPPWAIELPPLAPIEGEQLHEWLKVTRGRRPGASDALAAPPLRSPYCHPQHSAARNMLHPCVPQPAMLASIAPTCGLTTASPPPHDASLLHRA